ncbi:MAG: DUF2804 domain-containing protein [Polyangiales bacterium]
MDDPRVFITSGHDEHPPPEDGVAADGRIHAGLFSAPVRRFSFDRSRSGAPTVEWYGAGLAHPDHYFGLIVVRANVGSMTSLYGFDRRNRRYFSHDAIATRSRAQVSASPYRGTTRFSTSGFELAIDHDLENHQHRVHVEVAARRGRPSVSGELVWHERLERSPALAALVPLGGSRFVYNHKAQMPISGSLRVGGETVEFSPNRDLANMDEVRARLGLSRLRYAWFNFAGFDASGEIVGLNAANVGALDEQMAAENVIWAGPRRTHVGPVTFEIDPRDLDRPWRARDREGRVDVTFHPEGGKAVLLGPLGRYHQKCGTFRGTLIDGEGRRREVDGYVGCAEVMRVLA